jgi:hypothetical protein
MKSQTFSLIELAQSVQWLDYGLDNPGSVPRNCRGSFLLHRCPGQLCGPPSLLSSGYRVIFPEGKTAGLRHWPLTSIHWRLRMGGIIPPLHMRPHGVVLNKKNTRDREIKRRHINLLRDAYKHEAVVGCNVNKTTATCKWSAMPNTMIECLWTRTTWSRNESATVSWGGNIHYNKS